MGHIVASANKREMEIIKSDTSYEVQVDFDKKTMKSTSYRESDDTTENATRNK